MHTNTSPETHTKKKDENEKTILILKICSFYGKIFIGYCCVYENVCGKSEKIFEIAAKKFVFSVSFLFINCFFLKR